MKQIFSFKKMSVKLSFIIAAMVVAIGGLACVYMQTRIIEEIDRYSRLYLRYRLMEAAEHVDVALAEGKELSYVEGVVKQVRLYDTGFAALSDSGGQFVDTNDLIRGFSSSEKSSLGSLAQANQNGTFDLKLGNVNYSSAQTVLEDGHSLYVFVPRSEVMADVYASITRFIFIFIVMVIIIIVISYFIGKSVAAPLTTLNKFLKTAGETGEITISANDMETLNGLMQQKDEIGQCVGATVEFFKHINNIAKELEAVAQGDLTIKLDILSGKDILGMSIQHTVDNLNDLFGDIKTSSDQVSAGSRQIAGGAQALAQGSTEQAASIQQLSSSISEIAQRTKANADTAGKTAKLSTSIKENAEKGSRQMDEMIVAVGEINEASKNINKIIKTIDDIAFQTNILALNAAVEAARAGQHGKGFAVVAEEVRNLASKSAEAAKDTGDMIQASMDKAELGSRIAGETAASLFEIVSGINESSQLISEIASASEEQTQGIAQINIGIDQVAQVVQQNSATAEESAAASEEMSSQSDALEQLISRFSLKTAPKGRDALPAPGGLHHYGGS